MPERFQPRTLATFNKHQLEQIILWGADNGVLAQKDSGIPFSEAGRLSIEAAQVDERGKMLDEKGRERLRLAFKAYAPLFSFGELSRLRTLSVWLMSDKPETLEFRWQHIGDSLESRATERRFLGRV